MPRIGESVRGDLPEVRRRERLGINVMDAQRFDASLRDRVLHGKVDWSRTMLVDKNSGDEVLAEFVCDLLTAATVVDILRSNDRKLKRSPCRVYLRRREAWQRLAGNAVLTKVGEDGKVELNPKAFVIEKQFVGVDDVELDDLLADVLTSVAVPKNRSRSPGSF